ncbi:MAG: 16S rRNA (cytosine(1402)-N(4))-methyltransferase RsmH [Mariprofundales bacterium]
MSIAKEQTHTPVMADPFVNAILGNNDVNDGIFVDATFGRGGHSRILLDKLSSNSRLIAFDRDPDAVAAAAELQDNDKRFSIVYAPFSVLDSKLNTDINAELETEVSACIQGIGFDLGVSSPQLDNADRGFSFQQKGPLDMRMDTNHDMSLLQRLSHVSLDELIDILFKFGQERYARRIAAGIIKARDNNSLHSTSDLENICFHATPKQSRYGKTHPATRTFQALRMWVNDELQQITLGLQAAMRVLCAGGRLAVLSFHSGEDRLVRDCIEQEVRGCVCPSFFPQCACDHKPSMRWIDKKPLRADADEILCNPRSRSARLRVAEKLA